VSTRSDKPKTKKSIGGEFKAFDDAMKTILRANPKAVKDAVEAEIETNTAEREARGELKRGRKPKKKATSSASGRASRAGG
jgi:hypothetical protein